MDNSTDNCDAIQNNTVTDAWGEEVPDPGKLSYITTTGVQLPLGVATRVGPVTVTTTTQGPGGAIAHVEGDGEALTSAVLTPLLGVVKLSEGPQANWHPEHGVWSEWGLYGGSVTDTDGNVVQWDGPLLMPAVLDWSAV